MKTKHFYIAVFMAFILIGCAKSPEKVYENMQKSAMKGDYDQFAEYFTKKSRPFVRALIELQKTDFGGDQEPSLPLKTLTQCAVVNKVKLQQGQVMLNLDCGDNKPRTLAFLKEDGKWRVDIKLTEDLRIHAGKTH